MSAAAEGQGKTAGEYIVHHLQHLQNQKQTAVVDFSVFNLDSIFYVILLGVVGSFLLYRAASKATAGVPGRFQAAVELLVEMVDSQAKGIVHSATSRKLVAPLALTVFVAWHSFQYVGQMMAIGRRSEAADIPMAIPHGAVALGFSLIALIALARCFGVRRTRRSEGSDGAST